jgi:hypothetical protein
MIAGATRESSAAGGAPPVGALVELGADESGAPVCLVRSVDGDRLDLEVLTPVAQVPRPSDTVVRLRGATIRALWPARIEDAHGMPLLAVRLTGAARALAAAAEPRIALTFPVRFELVPEDLAGRARQVRARLAAAEPPAASGDGEPELALLAVAKLLARVDTRCDRLLERGAPPAAGADAARPPADVLVFSLARMMVARLDRKFDRVLAALRDPAVLGRGGEEAREDDEAATGRSAQVATLHALTRMLERIDEKLDRALGGAAAGGADAWGLAAGEEGVTLGLSRPVALDSVLELELRLPFFPPMPLVVLGRVVAAHEETADVPERRFRALAELIGVGDVDRDLLVQTLFRSQRGLLRARHAGRPVS